MNAPLIFSGVDNNNNYLNFPSDKVVIAVGFVEQNTLNMLNSRNLLLSYDAENKKLNYFGGYPSYPSSTFDLTKLQKFIFYNFNPDTFTVVNPRDIDSYQICKSMTENGKTWKQTFCKMSLLAPFFTSLVSLSFPPISPSPLYHSLTIHPSHFALSPPFPCPFAPDRRFMRRFVIYSPHSATLAKRRKVW